MSTAVQPQVSKLFQPSSRQHGIAWYRSDIPDTAWDEAFDGSNTTITNPSDAFGATSSKTEQVRLCSVCEAIDIERAFHHGLPSIVAKEYDGSQTGLFLGSLLDVAAREQCPMCRLIFKVYLQKHRAGSGTADSSAQVIWDSLCYLSTISSDQAGFARQMNGPPTHFMDIIFYKDEKPLPALAARYLTLDVASHNLADPSWVDIRNTIIATDETSSDSDSDDTDDQQGPKAVVEYGEITDSDNSDEEELPDGQSRRYYNVGRQIRQSQVDYSLLKSWLDFCEDVHAFRGCLRPAQRICESFRVIDVVAREIVAMASACRYVALSYVWGQSASTSATYSLTKGRLPQTIEDAMVVVERMGERYLWVDAYCIHQDDPNDKLAQVKLMHKIYNCAIFTIAAAAGINAEAGLPGVRPGTRIMTQESEKVNQKLIHITLPLIRESLENPCLGSKEKSDGTTGWINRGWTMQEGFLSRRCLIFTTSQVFFQCCSGFYAESVAEVLDHQRRGLASSNTTKDLICGNLVGLMDDHKDDDLIHYDTTEYFRFIKEYSRRSLSFNSDRLHAIKGITKALELVYGTTFIWGLPEGALDFALLWVPTSRHEKTSRDPNFPSWSWAAWPGSIDYYVYDDSSAGANAMLNTSGDLLETGANIRKHNVYWKYNRGARPKEIVQKQVRYPAHLEKKFGCIKKNGAVKLDTYVRSGARPQMHLMQLDNMATETPLLSPSLRAKLDATGTETVLPVLVFTAVSASMYLVKANDCGRQFQCRCKAFTRPDWRHTIAQLDECVFVDAVEDADRLDGQMCHFLFLSICEPTRSPYTLLINVMLVERVGAGIYKRLGVGYVLSTTWSDAKKEEETVHLV